MMPSKNKWIVISTLLLLVSFVTSLFLSDACLQIRAIGILLACMVLWISEALPISISSLFMLCLLPLFGIMDFGKIISNFGTNTSLFIMASSGITVALVSSSIPNRIMYFVFSRFGKKPIGLLYCFAIAVSLFSAFVSSLATCTLFTMMTSAILSRTVVDAKKSNVGKALMLIIPACSGIGGFMSPAGTPANLLVIDLLKQNGIEISFTKWCAIGFPIGLIAVTIFVSSVVIHFKPESEIELHCELVSKATKKDYIIAVVVLLTITGWIISGFIPNIDITLIALLSLCILFIPKLNILDFQSFQNGVNWDLVLSMGSVSVLMGAISGTGLIQDFVSIAFRGIEIAPAWVVLIAVSLCICILRSFIPTTTAVIALFAPLIASLSVATNTNITSLLFVLSFWSASALLLVYTEPIYLITYKEGYFKAGDLLRTGIIPCLLLSVISGFAINFFVNILF